MEIEVKDQDGNMQKLETERPLTFYILSDKMVPVECSGEEFMSWITTHDPVIAKTSNENGTVITYFGGGSIFEITGLLKKGKFVTVMHVEEPYTFQMKDSFTYEEAMLTHEVYSKKIERIAEAND